VPVVTTTSSGAARAPRDTATCRAIASRSAGVPAGSPYALVPSTDGRSCRATRARQAAYGKCSRDGMPARRSTSGRTPGSWSAGRIVAQTGCGSGGAAGSAAPVRVGAGSAPPTNTPLPGLLRTRPSAASRSYAATTVLRDTSSRSASSREDGSGSARRSRPSRMAARSCR
jgi:hypothetical protein